MRERVAVRRASSCATTCSGVAFPGGSWGWAMIATQTPGLIEASLAIASRAFGSSAERPDVPTFSRSRVASALAPRLWSLRVTGSDLAGGPWSWGGAAGVVLGVVVGVSGGFSAGFTGGFQSGFFASGLGVGVGVGSRKGFSGGGRGSTRRTSDFGRTVFPPTPVLIV
jgi:hypothetical protein